MRHSRFLFAVILLIFAFASQADIQSEIASDDVLSLFRLSRPAPKALAEVAGEFEIVARHGQDYEVIVPRAKTDRLLKLVPSAQVLETDISAGIRVQLAQYSLESGFSEYHNFEQVQEWLKSIETRYPRIAKVLSYGSSRQGRPLLALRLSRDITQEPGPALMFTAATHGDELITVEVLMSLVDQLVENHGKDARFTNLLGRHDLYFIPVVNPDGFVNVSRYDNGSDPNRSYPYPGHEERMPTASIAAVIGFFMSHQIIGSIDFHASGELVMYPWAYTRQRVSDEATARFSQLTSSMASTNGYTAGPISEVIYVAPGSSADYYFWKSSSVSLGIEIGQSKVPHPRLIPNEVRSQAESTWRFIESF